MSIFRHGSEARKEAPPSELKRKIVNICAKLKHWRSMREDTRWQNTGDISSMIRIAVGMIPCMGADNLA